jgi:hypothetical protein
LVEKFWVWLCTNQAHLHTAFETVEQTLLLNESKERLSSTALQVGKKRTVWAVSIEVLKSQMVG